MINAFDQAFPDEPVVPRRVRRDKNGVELSAFDQAFPDEPDFPRQATAQVDDSEPGFEVGMPTPIVKFGEVRGPGIPTSIAPFEFLATEGFTIDSSASGPAQVGRGGKTGGLRSTVFTVRIGMSTSRGHPGVKTKGNFVKDVYISLGGSKYIDLGGKKTLVRLFIQVPIPHNLKLSIFYR